MPAPSGNPQRQREPAVAAGKRLPDEIIVERGFARYIDALDFAVRDAPGGVGTLARIVGKRVAAASGDAIG
jgi:hypothetical protein